MNDATSSRTSHAGASRFAYPQAAGARPKRNSRQRQTFEMGSSRDVGRDRADRVWLAEGMVVMDDLIPDWKSKQIAMRCAKLRRELLSLSTISRMTGVRRGKVYVLIRIGEQLLSMEGA